MYKILRLTAHGKDQLEKAEFLGEYDAICLDPSWPLFGIEAGRDITWPRLDNHVHNFSEMKALLERRSSELWRFFTQGGLLVVRLVEPAKVRIGGVNEVIDSFRWWYGPAAGSADGRIPGTWNTYITHGSGPMEVLEPGHPFESVLREIKMYGLRLASNWRNVVVLAQNRAGDPVAVEVECQKGALILLPPSTTEGQEYLLDAAIQNALQSRLGVAHEWEVSDEKRLVAERDAVLREMREKRHDIDQRLVRTREIKDGILQMLHVSRAIGYYRKATGGTPTPKTSIPVLWSLTEMLRERFNKGTSTLAVMLNLPKDDLEFIDTLANNRDLDLRHTTGGEPKVVEPAELQRALAVGKAVVEAVIEYEYRASTAVPVAANGERKASS